MPSSTLPTGTVSRGSRSARTFPPEAEIDPTAGGERPRAGHDPSSDRSAQSAVVRSDRGDSARSNRSGPDRSAPASASATTAPPSSEPATDASLPSASAPNSSAPNASTPNSSARIAELERENDELKREVAALRDRLRRKREELQDVIDRYEGLLSEAKRSSGSNRPGRSGADRRRPSRRESSGAYFGGVRSRLGTLGDGPAGLFDRLFGRFDH